eukprot:7455292-Karenia_brevis.AAC.1
MVVATIERTIEISKTTQICRKPVAASYYAACAMGRHNAARPRSLSRMSQPLETIRADLSAAFRFVNLVLGCF